MTRQAANPNPDSALAEQLVELSSLTGGLAHEIRNPLSTLKVNLQLLDEDWKQIEENADCGREAQDVARRSRRRIESLLEESARLERILGDFLKYVGKRELKRSPQDLAAVMRDLADFYRPQAEHNHIEFNVQTPNEAILCDIDAQLIKQAVLNLLINAQQAMASGGRLELSVSLAADGHARVDVRDSGPGIPPDRQAHVFEAYYSTRKGGTGLGLATARQIVREHGGGIEVQSSPGQGACFSIFLPRTSA
ncbi:MAG TPA: ATP-binding protein [Phycisphaerae bacterium]|nr:ATP-binding protein [Phycisphaerae bacterium]